MNMFSVLSYIGYRFVHRIIMFFEHWYIGAFVVIYGEAGNIIKRIDGTFAIKVTLRNFFKPLYQDRDVLGYILGFIFRSFRILIGTIIYIFIWILTTIIYIVWAIIPLFLVFKIFQSF